MGLDFLTNNLSSGLVLWVWIFRLTIQVMLISLYYTDWQRPFVQILFRQCHVNLTTFCKQTWRGGVSSPVLLFCQTNRRFARFYLPKFLLVGLLWVVAVTLASWQEYNELHDPTYYYRLDATNFMVRVCMCVCVCVMSIFLVSWVLPRCSIINLLLLLLY